MEKHTKSGTEGGVPKPPRVHPFMPPDELIALWRSVQARFTQERIDEIVADYEKRREEED